LTDEENLHPSSIFYTRRFKNLIAELKRQGVFREAPLYELDKFAYLAATPLYIWPLLVWHDGFPSLQPIFLFVFVMVPLWAFETRYWINRVIIPCTMGTLKPVVVDENSISYAPRRRGWRFCYFFEGDERSGSFLGIRIPKEYRSPLIPKKLFDKQKFIAEPNTAFVISDNPDESCPYIEGIVQKYRMTTAPLTEAGSGYSR